MDGIIEKHKASIGAKDFSQQEGINYTKTFAPIAKMNLGKEALSFVASFSWEVHPMDVKSAFLHGDLNEEIYMEQPPNFVQEENLVCKPNKSLYGLK